VSIGIRDQVLISSFANISYWRRMGNAMREYISINFKNAYDSVTSKVLHSILIQFGVPIKLVRLTKFKNKNKVKLLIKISN
jgi:hypothetical protein